MSISRRMAIPALLVCALSVSAFVANRHEAPSVAAVTGPFTGIHLIDATKDWQTVVWQYPDKSIATSAKLTVTPKPNGDLDIQDSAFNNHIVFRGGSIVEYQEATSGLITIWVKR